MRAVTGKMVAFCLLAITSNLYSQEALPNDSTWNRNIGLQLSMVFSYYNDDHSSYYSNPGINLTIRDNSMGFSFKPAVRLTTRGGNTWDFGFEELYYTVNENARVEEYDSISGTILITGQKTTSFSLWVSGEYDFIFLKKAEGKIKPFIGLGSGIFYKYTGNKPAASNDYDTSHGSLGTTLDLIPGGLINFDNGYLTISSPINLGAFAIKVNQTDNPALPEKSRKTTTWDYDYFTKFRIRFSYGIYIR